MLAYSGLTDPCAQAYRAGGPDAHGLPAERGTSPGAGTPCRRCLRNVPKGAEMLILAHRPFETLHPYAECGPIFLCASACAPVVADVPEVLRESPDYLVKGYNRDERIVYGTGAVVPAADVPAHALDLLTRSGIVFVDVRSARNNCWLVRLELAQ